MHIRLCCFGATTCDGFCSPDSCVFSCSMAKNGVAHAIDAVLIPYWYYFGVASLAVAVQEEVGLTKLVELVVCADLVELLDTTFGITVFAPTDDAFAGINEEICEMPDLLTKILSYHVVPKVIPSTLIGKSDSYMTLEGSDVLLASTKDGVTVNGANVVVPNVLAYNGIGTLLAWFGSARHVPDFNASFVAQLTPSFFIQCTSLMKCFFPRILARAKER
jgi:hypothetical protein